MSKDVKIIYKKKYIEGDHDEHVDERWLVSYSDMMTLLFGLFVMLYAMQDPEATKQMQESIKQKFAQEHPNQAPEEPPVNAEELQKQLAALTAQLAEQEKNIKEANELKAKVAALEDEAAKAKQVLNQQLAENEKIAAELKKVSTDNEAKTRSIASIASDQKTADDLQKEKTRIEDKLKTNEADLKIKSDELLKMKEELSKKTALLEKLEKEKQPKPKEKDFEKEYLSELEKAKTLDLKNKELESKIKTIEEKGSFLAIVLNWFTNEHDLDLVVKDPNGKKFTFKTKEFPNYPGKIVLDSRRGPGAEIWQADKVIPGVYEAEITFYNQYGNPAPAEGKMVIFSTRGNIEVPDIKLDLGKNPKRKISFEISQLGEIKLK